MPMPMPILMPRYQCRYFQMAPKSWKWGMLRTVIKRAYVICSTSNLLLDHILFVFQKYNNFPKWVIDQVLHQEKENHHVVRRVQPEINEVSNEKSHILVLPYARQKGERLIKGFTLTSKLTGLFMATFYVQISNFLILYKLWQCLLLTKKGCQGKKTGKKTREWLGLGVGLESRGGRVPGNFFLNPLREFRQINNKKLTDGLVFKDLNTQNNYSATKNVYVHMWNSLKIIKAF